MDTKKVNISFWSCCVFSLLVYIGLGYFIKREETVFLFTGVTIVFAIYFYLINTPSLLTTKFNQLVFTAFVFRLIFLFSIPSLSDDFYRFIWDGRLTENGISPFSFRPDFVMEKGWLSGTENDLLYTNMTSPAFCSVYPGVLQTIFFISSKLSVNNFYSVVILRVFIIVAEFGTFYYLRKILEDLRLPKEKIFLYLLNPLVIIELTGNLHFEAVMLFFICVSIYFFLRNNYWFSSVAFALAVSTKLIPLLLVPLIIKRAGLKNGLIFFFVASILSLLMFIPFINSDFILNIGDSIGLYFRKFEFNASVYYILRGIGSYITGYNAITVIGKILAMLTFFIVIYYSFRLKKEADEVDWLKTMLTVLFVYYLLALIIHPWYVSFLLLINVFAERKYVLVWSLMIFATYFTYASKPYQENLWMVTLEYLTVFSVLLFEGRRLNRIKVFNQNS